MILFWKELDKIPKKKDRGQFIQSILKKQMITKMKLEAMRTI